MIYSKLILFSSSIIMLNKYSKTVTQDSSQPAAQAMLHAIGLSEDDLKKPFVGIASTGTKVNLVICI